MSKNLKTRVETDSLGEIKVPKDALWGAQTQRAIENFPISGIKFKFPFGRSFLKALGVFQELHVLLIYAIFSFHYYFQMNLLIHL